MFIFFHCSKEGSVDLTRSFRIIWGGAEMWELMSDSWMENKGDDYLKRPKIARNYSRWYTVHIWGLQELWLLLINNRVSTSVSANSFTQFACWTVHENLLRDWALQKAFHTWEVNSSPRSGSTSEGTPWKQNTCWIRRWAVSRAEQKIAVAKGHNVWA